MKDKIKETKELAENGDPKAALMLGQYYSGTLEGFGITVDKNIDEAVKWLLTAEKNFRDDDNAGNDSADTRRQGRVTVDMALELIFLDEDNIGERHLDLAVRVLSKGGLDGKLVYSQFTLYKLLSDEKSRHHDPAGAFKALLASGRGCYYAAQRELARLYFEGVKIRPNASKASNWLLRSFVNGLFEENNKHASPLPKKIFENCPGDMTLEEYSEAFINRLVPPKKIGTRHRVYAYADDGNPDDDDPNMYVHPSIKKPFLTAPGKMKEVDFDSDPDDDPGDSRRAADQKTPPAADDGPALPPEDLRRRERNKRKKLQRQAAGKKGSGGRK
ncbi:MAG: hypothetical protein LBO05_07895 [Deltaproteobacteria bacterium]|nr:hypothetical protein [Deltaproteobacteria bacterium]